jgi:LacI family transcriptional regulator
VGEEKRAQILRACEELNYRPSAIAKGLRHGTVPMLGLLLGDAERLASIETISGVINEARRRGQQALVSFASGGAGGLREDVGVFIAYQCAGLLFTTAVDSDRVALEELVDAGLCFVLVIREVPGLSVDFVGVDDRWGGRVIARHVLSHGHRRVGVLSGPHVSSSSRGRSEGCMEVLREAGLPERDVALVESSLTMAGGRQAAAGLIESHAPSAIICLSDDLALGAIDAVMDAGLRVPEDVAITGYDDIAAAGSRRIRLTTVHVPRSEIGAKAVELLGERIVAPGRDAVRVLLEQQLVVRGTCGCV